MSDVKSLGFKDASTLMQVMKTKATGELQDDKTMLMGTYFGPLIGPFICLLERQLYKKYVLQLYNLPESGVTNLESINRACYASECFLPDGSN